MPRLIDANKLEPIQVYRGDVFCRMVFMADIDNAPTVDAEPIRHGHWIQREKCEDYESTHDYRYECSNCGYSDIHDSTIEVPYCWHCGAKMDEVEDGA